MNFSYAVKSMIKPHEKDVLTPLSTVFSENLDPKKLFPEYPRPQLQREAFINLNGYWDYAITATGVFPSSYEGKILVPFSPESRLSGVNRQLQPGEFLWYHTTLPDLSKTDTLAENPVSGKRLLLHFGAIDHFAEIYLNEHLITSHKGCYLPFYTDITGLLKKTDNHLLVKVQDSTELGEQPRGKQSLHRGGIFYTAQSGIWQSVWMEWVPASYMEKLWFETDYNKKEVTAHISARLSQPSLSLTLTALYHDKELISQKIQLLSGSAEPSVASRISESARTPEVAMLTEASSLGSILNASLTFHIPQEDFHPWSPEEPFLYDVQLQLGEDKVTSYFALRCFTIEKSKGIPLFCLNHKPYFLMGVLDQGYWPEGLYTAPSDEALIYDIQTMKDLGFNMLRKHIKIENQRFYYHCDRLGMLVCQDMVNGGGNYPMPLVSYLPTLFPRLSSHIRDSHYRLLSRKNRQEREAWEAECVSTIEHLKFFPCIAIYCPFNEGWGQFDALRITEKIRSLDPSRLIDSASGWFDQGCGDFISEHNYFRPLSVPVKKWGNRAYLLSEYGGYACHLKGHTCLDRIFGYKRYATLTEFRAAYRELIQKSLLPLKKQGLSGSVYTQLSDVEEEVNGLLTYDRKINKLRP